MVVKRCVDVLIASGGWSYIIDKERVMHADDLPIDYTLIESLREFGVSDPELAEYHVRVYLAGATTFVSAKEFMQKLLSESSDLQAINQSHVKC